MSWTDERVELLKKLWSDGLSASQIAAELGGITRNAVIGKVHRLGCPAAPRARRAPRRVRARRARRRICCASGGASIRGNTALAHAYDIEAEAEPELIDNIIPIGQRRTILELNEQTCRWPVGDPGSGDFFFCGGNTLGGCPIAPITRAWPISRPATVAATAGRRAESAVHASRSEHPQASRTACARFTRRIMRTACSTHQLALPSRSS